MRFRSVGFFVLGTGMVFFLAGCAATRPEPEVAAKQEERQKVDQILQEEKKQKEQQRKDEAEVLRLLGIEPEQEKTGAGTEEKKQALASQAANLERELRQKEAEIERLKRELEQRDQKVAELESVLNDLKSAPEQPAVATESSGTGTAGPISLEEYKRRYQAALAEYRSRNYNTAIRMFEELLRIDSNNSYSDNAQYWIGECYYGLGMYERALVEFEKVFAFVNSNKEDDAQLKIALCYKNLNRPEQAKEALQRLIMKYPKSEYIPIARKLLNQL
jgi:tol-pal system protein YbgF